jgi:NitT/TauT family transport system permease protein
MANVLSAESGSGPFVEVSSVSLRYGEDDVTSKLALEGTSLTIDRGEFTAVVGPSGCGKSTLLKLLSGLRLPDKGRVDVDGKEITKPINSVGMAFQNPIMLPWRSTMDNILLPLEVVEPHRRKIRNREEYAKYVEAASVLLRQVGLTKVERTFPWQLSGGMQQRVSLCRALIHTPQLLLLDEPFGALDAFTREELWDVLQGLREQHNFTVLLVTHDLTEASIWPTACTSCRHLPAASIAGWISIFPGRGPRRFASRSSSWTTFTNCGRISGAPDKRQRADMTRRKLLLKVTPLLSVVLFFLLWEALCRVLGLPSFVLPRPTEILQVLIKMWSGIWPNALHTLITTLLGFGLAVVFGVVLGVAVGSSIFLYTAANPLLIGFNAIPKVALVPVLVLWFGIGTVPAVLTAFLTAFFPIMVNVATGIATVEPEMRDVLRSLGASKIDIVRKIGIPRSLPYFFASLKVAIALAFVGAVISETIASNVGIGYLMMTASASFQVPLVFAGLLVIAAMGIVMYMSAAVLERRWTGWATRGSGTETYVGGG